MDASETASEESVGEFVVAVAMALDGVVDVERLIDRAA